MGFVAWLLLAAAILFLYSAVKGTSPLETTRALFRGEPVPNAVHIIGERSGPKIGPEQGQGAGGGSAGGALVMPITGEITSPYGPRFGRMHHGVDIAAGTGTPVRAAGGGLVEVAGWRGGYGNAVYLDHGRGVQTRYAHLSKITVDRGQTVSRGQTVGLVGSTGDSSGPHLHFEVRVDGASRDPLEVIGGVRV